MRRTLIYQILPLFVAVVCSTVIFKTTGIDKVIVDTNKISVPQTEIGIFDNYRYGVQREADVIYALKNNTLIVFGSSELTSRDTSGFHSNVFLPKNFNIPTMSLGHAGNQCLSILTQLSALSKYAKGRKMVFIISPGWFNTDYGHGTSVNSFLEFNSPRFLKNIIDNDKLDVKYKNHISEYVSRNFDQIKNPDFFIRELNSMAGFKISSPVDYPAFKFLDLIHVKTETNLYEELNITENRDFEIKKADINWNEIEQGIISKLPLTSNNPAGVANNYYRKFKKKEKKPDQTIESFDNIQELKDFKMLVSLCHDLNIDAAFVIQPLNPHIYKDLTVYKPLISEIKRTITDKSMLCLDMFEYTVKDYTKGHLIDAMHMGDLAWLKVNRFIYDNLYSNEQKN